MHAQLVARLKLEDAHGNISYLSLRCAEGRELIATLATAGHTPESLSNLGLRVTLPAFWPYEGKLGGRAHVAPVIEHVAKYGRRSVIGAEVSPCLPSGFEYGPEPKACEYGSHRPGCDCEEPPARPRRKKRS